MRITVIPIRASLGISFADELGKDIIHELIIRPEAEAEINDAFNFITSFHFLLAHLSSFLRSKCTTVK